VFQLLNSGGRGAVLGSLDTMLEPDRYRTSGAMPTRARHRLPREAFGDIMLRSRCDDFANFSSYGAMSTLCSWSQ
jgi:hypothetical protein